MADPIVQIYPDLDALSAAAAATFAQTAQLARSEGRVAWIAVSGGSTPRRLFEVLADLPWRDRVPWDCIQIVQVDERPVPPNHPDSNFRELNELLLSRVPIPPGHVLRVRAELGPDSASREYERALRECLPVTVDSFPRLDLVFLGLGDDGHTASLFPHSPGLREAEHWVIANPVAKLGVSRITLTYPVLNSAREVVFLVSGASKAPVLGQVLNGARNVAELPAQGIQPANGILTWLIDAAAACRL